MQNYIIKERLDKILGEIFSETLFFSKVNYAFDALSCQETRVGGYLGNKSKEISRSALSCHEAPVLPPASWRRNAERVRKINRLEICRKRELSADNGFYQAHLHTQALTQNLFLIHLITWLSEALGWLYTKNCCENQLNFDINTSKARVV